MYAAAKFRMYLCAVTKKFEKRCSKELSQVCRTFLKYPNMEVRGKLMVFYKAARVVVKGEGQGGHCTVFSGSSRSSKSSQP